MKFSIVGSLFGAVLIIISIIFWRQFPRNQQLWRIIPREKRFGAVIGFFSLIWSAAHTYPLLEGGLLKFRAMLPFLVILITILSLFYLDYLFTRATGGFLLLTVNWLLHEAFVVHAPYRPLFAMICYTIGIIGLIMIALPYRFRDILEKITTLRHWRMIISMYLCLSGGIVLFICASRYAL